MTPRDIESSPYEAPALVILGSVAELTRQGATPVDEADFDGSQA